MPAKAKNRRKEKNLPKLKFVIIVCVFAYSSSDFRLTPFKYFVLLCTNMVSQLDTIKKTWIPTVVVPRIEALALPVSLEQQREAHAEYKYTLVLHS